MRGLTLAALFLLPSFAAAETANFRLWWAPNRREELAFSADAYHYAGLDKDSSGNETWMRDGKAVAKGPDGAFTAIEAGHTDDTRRALSRDGALLAYIEKQRDANGQSLGYAVSVNGKRVGSIYADAKNLTLSAGGRNLAYAGRTAQGWSVVSIAGSGPVFTSPPGFINVSDSGLVYLAHWSDRQWLYQDAKPPAAKDYVDMSAAADLSRVSGVLIDHASDMKFVEIGDARLGPFNTAQAPAFSADGRHYAFLAVDAAGWGIVVDGARTALTGTPNGIIISPAGKAYWFVPGADGYAAIAYMAGKPLKVGQEIAASNESGREQHWIAFSRSGAHSAFLLEHTGLVVDGRKTDDRLDASALDFRIAFDGENSFHIIYSDGASIRLACGTTDGSDPARTKCAAYGRAHSAVKDAVLPDGEQQ